MDTPTIRTTTAEDSAIVYKMICFLEEITFDRTEFTAVYLENLLNPGIRYLICEVSRKAVGIISIHIQNELHHCGKVAEVMELFVFEEFRSMGIGALLLKKAEDIARKEKCKLVEMATNRRRLRTHEFYLKNLYIKSHLKFTKKLFTGIA